MQHIQAEQVFDLDIGSILYQDVESIDIASEGCVMESCELILKRLKVDPVLQLFLIELLLGNHDQFLGDLLLVLVDRQMEEGEPIGIDQVCDCDIFTQLFSDHLPKQFNRVLVNVLRAESDGLVYELLRLTLLPAGLEEVASI